MNATNLAQHYLYEEEARIVPAMMQEAAQAKQALPSV
jgi:hypothetical protein